MNIILAESITLLILYLLISLCTSSLDAPILIFLIGLKVSVFLQQRQNIKQYTIKKILNIRNH